MAQYAIAPGLRSILEKQCREYDQIACEACRIASLRGWDLRDAEPAVCFLSEYLYRKGLRRRNCDQVISRRIIRHNRRSLIRERKMMDSSTGEDSKTDMLTRRLMDCQQENMKNAEKFL